MPRCAFCKIPKEKIIYECEYFLAIFDEFPVLPGHALIISKRHCLSLMDLSSKEFLDLKFALKEVIEKIEKTNFKALYENFLKNPLNEKSRRFCEKALKSPFLNKKPNGFNIGVNEGKAAGRTIDHLHIHIIPRYLGDVKNPRGGIRNIIPNIGDYK